jgi:hypothetical protein
MRFDRLYTPPRSNVVSTEDHGWDGKYFRLRSPGAMPPWCLSCGDDEASIEKTEKLHWANPFTFMWIFLHPIALMAAYLVVVRRVPVTYRHCTGCATRSAHWTTAMHVSFAVFGLALAGAIAADHGGGPAGVLVALACLAFATSIVCTVKHRPSMAIRKHRQGMFYVGRLSKAFRARFGA